MNIKLVLANTKRKSLLFISNTFKILTSIIKQAAKEFNIDPYLLGSIVIDESVRLGAFEEVRDSFFLQLVGRNVSVGIAQLKLETANGLIKGEFYNPNPEDKKLPFIDQLRNDDRRYIYQYVSPPKHNLRFAAAFLRSLIDEWKSILDISKRPEVLGTFYSLSHQKPSTRPKILPRGRQIAEEFYGYAKKWLK